MKKTWKGWTVGKPYLSKDGLAKGYLSIWLPHFLDESVPIILIPWEYLEIDLDLRMGDIGGILPGSLEIVREEWSGGHSNIIDNPGKEIVLIKDGAPRVKNSRSIALWLGVACQKAGTGNPRNYPGYWLAGPFNVWDIIYVEIPLTR